MVLIVVWVVVALVAASGVLVLAAWLTSEPAPATFVTDLRAGLRASRGGRGARRSGIFATARRELADVADVEPSSVEDIFTVGRSTDQDYLDTERITAGLVRTIGRVAQSR